MLIYTTPVNENNISYKINKHWNYKAHATDDIDIWKYCKLFMLKEKNVLLDIKQLLHRDTLLHTVKHCSTTTTGLTCIRMEGSSGV